MITFVVIDFLVLNKLKKRKERKQCEHTPVHQRTPQSTDFIIELGGSQFHQISLPTPGFPQRWTPAKQNKQRVFASKQRHVQRKTQTVAKRIHQVCPMANGCHGEEKHGPAGYFKGTLLLVILIFFTSLREKEDRIILFTETERTVGDTAYIYAACTSFPHRASTETDTWTTPAFSNLNVKRCFNTI